MPINLIYFVAFFPAPPIGFELNLNQIGNQQKNKLFSKIVKIVLAENKL